MYCLIDTCLSLSNYAFVIKPLRVNLLINTRIKKDCGRSYLQTVSFLNETAVYMKYKSTVQNKHISLAD